MMFKTPILFVIFNRPEPTKLVFEEIKKVKPLKLFIAADGPRSENIADIENCKNTRAIIDLIDWECEVKTLFRENNKGCGLAVSEAITWFFNEVEEGIILEDDCLPNPTFFNYCENLLSVHRYDEKVMHIGGSNFLFNNIDIADSYYYSSVAHVWGWASWRRAWKKYNYNVSDFYLFVRDQKIYNYHSNKHMAEWWLEIFQKMYYKKINTWDYQWVYSIYNNNGVAIIPKVNLISNIGFGSEATHTFSSDSIFSKVKSDKIEMPLNHPPTIIINKIADTYFFKEVEKLPFYQKPKPKILTRIINKIFRLLKLK